MSRWNPSSRQQRINAAKAARKSDETEEEKPKPKPKGGNTTGGKKKPQPDTTDRNKPCNKALAHKKHMAHRYRRGDQQYHCPGVQ